jgi:hypothetical protein
MELECPQRPDTGLHLRHLNVDRTSYWNKFVNLSAIFLFCMWNLVISCAVRPRTKELLAPSVCRVIVARPGCSSLVHLSAGTLLAPFLIDHFLPTPRSGCCLLDSPAESSCTLRYYSIGRIMTL